MDEAERLRPIAMPATRNTATSGCGFCAEHACQRANRENQPARQQRLATSMEAGTSNLFP
jgi:hypothetical protein